MGDVSKLDILATFGAENIGNGAGVYMGNEPPDGGGHRRESRSIMTFKTIKTTGNSLSITENSTQILISGATSDGSEELIVPTSYNSFLYSDIVENVLMYTGVVNLTKADNLKNGDGSLVASLSDIDDVQSFDRDEITPIPIPSTNGYMVLLLPDYMYIEGIYDYYFNGTRTSRFLLTTNGITIGDVFYNIYVTVTTSNALDTISNIFGGFMGLAWQNIQLFLTYNASSNMIWRELKINDEYDSLLSINSVGKPIWGGLPRFPVIKTGFSLLQEYVPPLGSTTAFFGVDVSLSNHRIYDITHNGITGDIQYLLLNIVDLVAGNYITVTINNILENDVTLIVYYNDDTDTSTDIYWSNVIHSSTEEPVDDALVTIDGETSHTLYITCENLNPVELFVNTIKIAKINVEE